MYVHVAMLKLVCYMNDIKLIWRGTKVHMYA